MTHYPNIFMWQLRPTRFRVQGSTWHADFFFSCHGLSDMMPAYRRGNAHRSTIDTAPFTRGPRSNRGCSCTDVFSHYQSSTPFTSHRTLLSLDLSHTPRTTCGFIFSMPVPTHNRLAPVERRRVTLHSETASAHRPHSCSAGVGNAT